MSDEQDDIEEEEEEAQEEEEEGESAENAGDHAAVADLDWADVISPLTVDEFKRDYWGRKQFATVLSDSTFRRIKSGFYKGELEMVVSDCRKDDNTKYTSEETNNMANELGDELKTVNIPFCFCPGALELKSAFIEHCGELGNDIEVGVYFSTAGGAASSWHYDNNHNITIQVCGQKDWHHIPGNPNTLGSRGMQEIARNRFEQQRKIPSTGCDNYTCYNLRPGSVIYLPPGHWHQVVPAEGSSFSVDIRIANVVHCRWICEALFAGLLDRFYSPDSPSQLQALGPEEFDGHIAGFQKQLHYVKSHAEVMLRCCRPPRCLPFEEECSDGLLPGATLAFLKRRGCVQQQHLPEDAEVGISGLMALALKRRDEKTLVLQLTSVSSLSTMEYLRFSIFCDIVLFKAAELLRTRGRATVAELSAACKIEPRRRKSRSNDVGAGGVSSAANIDDAVQTLLSVLLYAHVLYCLDDGTVQEESARGKHDKGMHRKRRRRS